jgi:predicted ATPase
MFAQRARAADAAFVLDAASLPQVASICGRVDDLPLAIELAAARIRTFGLAGLDERLSSRLTLLTGGPRDLPARQQTLRETLSWSVTLLDARERDVLARLAVFAGSFPMDAAHAVAGADDDVMSELVDHHLVQIVGDDGGRRYRLLETVREYAYELLGAQREVAEAALVDWIIDVVAGTDLDIGPGTQVAKLGRLDAALDSLRDTLRHAARDPDPSRELAIAGGVWRYWLIRGHLAEGRAILDDLLVRRGLVESTVGVRAARGAASLAYSMGDVERASALADEVLVAALRVADPVEVVHAYNLAGVVANGQLEYDAAERHYLEAIRVADGIREVLLASRSAANLASSYLDQGRLDDARDRFEAVLELRRPQGLSEGLGFAHLNLGEIELEAGDLVASEAHYRSAAASFEAVGFGSRLANAYQGLAAVEARTGRADSAARRLGVAATMLGEVGWGADGTGAASAATEAARQHLGDATFERLFGEGAASVLGGTDG